MSGPALSVAPEGFTVAELAAKINDMGVLAGSDYTVRQAAYDIRKLRALFHDLRLATAA